MQRLTTTGLLRLHTLVDGDDGAAAAYDEGAPEGSMARSLTCPKTGVRITQGDPARPPARREQVAGPFGERRDAAIDPPQLHWSGRPPAKQYARVTRADQATLSRPPRRFPSLLGDQ
jgi:hypothetical protein